VPHPFPWQLPTASSGKLGSLTIYKPRILLVFADPVLFPTVYPYGLEVVKSAVNASLNAECKITQPFLSRKPDQYLVDEVASFQPDVIGFSFRNLDEAGFGWEEDGEFTFLPQLTKLVDAIREYQALVVLGGSGFSIAPVQILKATGVSVGFVGPSEDQFVTFLKRYLWQKLPLEQAIAGLSFAVTQNSSPAAHAPKAALLGGLKVGYSPTTRKLSRLTGGTVGIRTKTGCNLNCSYCVVPKIEPLLLREWDDIKAELEEIQAANLQDRVFIADGEFNLPDPQHAIDLCNKISATFGSAIHWRCYIDPAFVSAELVEAMERAGCIGVSLTADSYSAEPRRGLTKGSPVENAIAGTRLFIDSTIDVTINLLFGAPRETLISVDETIQHAEQFHQDGAHLAITIGLRVYPNTPLAKLATNRKFAPYYRPLSSYDWLGVFCSPLDRAELAKLVLDVLPEGERISYTNQISHTEKTYYKSLAEGAMLSIQGNHSAAKAVFSSLIDSNPDRREAVLGLAEELLNHQK
jgi:hypothetical protein